MFGGASPRAACWHIDIKTIPGFRIFKANVVSSRNYGGFTLWLVCYEDSAAEELTTEEVFSNSTPIDVPPTFREYGSRIDSETLRAPASLGPYAVLAPVRSSEEELTLVPTECICGKSPIPRTPISPTSEAKAPVSSPGKISKGASALRVRTGLVLALVHLFEPNGPNCVSDFMLRQISALTSSEYGTLKRFTSEGTSWM
jgi:hypothetical protein